ncbi:MAG: hypothetical protein ABSA11_14815 [Candidatus Bathyarchaeia archaeon]
MLLLDNKESLVLQSPARYEGKAGNLYLTNARLIFEYIAGLLSKKTYRALDLKLTDILSIQNDERVQKLTIKSSRRAGLISLTVEKPNYWEYQIGLMLV